MAYNTSKAHTRLNIKITNNFLEHTVFIVNRFVYLIDYILFCFVIHMIVFKFFNIT